MEFNGVKYEVLYSNQINKKVWFYKLFIAFIFLLVIIFFFFTIQWNLK